MGRILDGLRDARPPHGPADRSNDVAIRGPVLAGSERAARAQDIRASGADLSDRELRLSGSRRVVHLLGSPKASAIYAADTVDGRPGRSARWAVCRGAERTR